MNNKKLSHFCEERFKKQCLSKHGSIGCKLRYVRKQCQIAIKQQKEQTK